MSRYPDDQSSTWEKFGAPTDIKGYVPVIFDPSINKFRPVKASDMGGATIEAGIGEPTDPPSGSPSDNASLISIQKAIFETVLKSLQFSQGQNGSIILTDSDSATGTFTGFTIINDTELAAITSTGDGAIDDSASLIGISIPAGVTLYGTFSAIEVSSGVIQVFKV